MKKRVWVVKEVRKNVYRKFRKATWEDVIFWAFLTLGVFCLVVMFAGAIARVY